MPFVYSQVRKLEGETKAGDGDCVDLIKKYFIGLPTVSAYDCWRSGVNVMEARNRITPGTAIATFVDGRYPRSNQIPKHAAIFLRSAGAGGIWVMDQWKESDAIHARIIHIARPREVPDATGVWPRANNVAEAFYVIEMSGCGVKK